MIIFKNIFFLFEKYLCRYTTKLSLRCMEKRLIKSPRGLQCVDYSVCFDRDGPVWHSTLDTISKRGWEADIRNAWCWGPSCRSPSLAEQGSWHTSGFREHGKDLEGGFTPSILGATITHHQGNMPQYPILLPASCDRSSFWTLEILFLSLAILQNNSYWLQWHLLLAQLFYLGSEIKSRRISAGDMKMSW